MGRGGAEHLVAGRRAVISTKSVGSGECFVTNKVREEVVGNGART